MYNSDQNLGNILAAMEEDVATKPEIKQKKRKWLEKRPVHCEKLKPSHTAPRARIPPLHVYNAADRRAGVAEGYRKRNIHTCLVGGLWQCLVWLRTELDRGYGSILLVRVRILVWSTVAGWHLDKKKKVNGFNIIRENVIIAIDQLSSRLCFR